VAQGPAEKDTAGNGNAGGIRAAAAIGPDDAPAVAGALAAPIEVVAVFGPTASGKTALAEALADALGTEVVSADAMQVYRGLPILTNQSPRPTRLVAVRELGEEMSVGAFAALAHAEIDELVRVHGNAVVAGGTGLYLRAALAELDVPPPVDPALRDRIREEVADDAADAHARLAALDPEAAELVHPHDRQRLVRALELAETGHSLAGGDRLWSVATRRPTLIVGLDVPSAELERRICARTDEMFANGVVDEVRAALGGRVSRTAEKTLGLAEIASLSADDARERIVVRTRRYAAYQRKWMRRIPGIVVLDGTRPLPDLVSDVLARARR
jgi:tRNA dimethylallyltransferase